VFPCGRQILHRGKLRTTCTNYERPELNAAPGFENNAYETLQTTQDSQATNESPEYNVAPGFEDNTYETIETTQDFEANIEDTEYITVNYAGVLEKRENNTKQNYYATIK